MAANKSVCFNHNYTFCTFYTANPFVSGLSHPCLPVKETTKTTEDKQRAKPLVLRHIDNFINHGRTRTGFANARLDSEWRKRKRGASVSVCGSSHKEHKGHKGGENPPGGTRPVASVLRVEMNHKSNNGHKTLDRSRRGATLPMRRVGTRALPPPRLCVRHSTEGFRSYFYF